MPRYDFEADSDGEQGHVGPPLQNAGDDDVVAWEETLYEDTGGNWKQGEWGPPIGKVTLRHYPTAKPGRIRVEAWFKFDDGDIVGYGGLVPVGAGNKLWKGAGSFDFLLGSGKFDGRGGHLDVDSTNPKHWG